ncbi:MAG: T9SS type B sorting domain-containing protein [Paludibacteraceae bacterium]|nr:T9SS type B sorting domain-containing protein [Paludibacteraceae bacterium]
MVRFITIHKRLIALLSLLLMVTRVDAAVQSHINSGNPAYPFPQFLSYTFGDSHSLGNLGTKNADGVVHAEMEQDIRDAWQIACNHFIYTGDELDGVKYIKGNEGMPYDGSEGDGYALLGAAYMADKTTFDGLWLRVHDKRITKIRRHIDGVVNFPNFDYEAGALIEADGEGVAPDGAFDVVMALYVAWKQWGDYMGIKDATGQPISYKKDLIEVVQGLVRRGRFQEVSNPTGKMMYSGCIGFDGFIKRCDKDGEATGWAYSNNKFVPAGYQALNSCCTSPCIDYVAPSYFHEFADLLQDFKDKSAEELANDSDEELDFMIMQFRRAESSSDWLISQTTNLSEKHIPCAGIATFNAEGNKITAVKNYADGEDFRYCWRTILNYMWHGTPTYTWNENTHEIEYKSNTFEYDVAKKFNVFLNSPQSSPWNTECKTFGGGPDVSFKGPMTLSYYYTPDGVEQSTFNLNWMPGVGSITAVAMQDYDLMGMLYRQCNIEWEPVGGTDNYLGSDPHYYHGWFRHLGMLVASGNYPAASQMNPMANMKIYRAIKDSVTFCYTGDKFTYLLDYRNYGSVDAEDVVIVENVPKDFVFISASDGGVYNESNRTVTWKIGTVPGFVTGGLSKTMGQVSYEVQVGPNASGRYCTTAEITCSNGSGWTSNEFPNYVTATYQRNCVDVIKRALMIEKLADVEMVNPGNTVTYTINFENSSKAGWLDGGRSRVNVAFANSGDANGSQLWLKFRLYNDAYESYINYGNYRVSYYIYDSNLKCEVSSSDCNVGWGWYTATYEGKREPTDQVTVSHETIVEDKDEHGRWNQRLILRFAPLLVTTTGHLCNYYGMGTRIHKGGAEPLRLFGYLFPSTWSSTNFGDDWSWDAKASDADDGNYYPITPSHQLIDMETGESIEIPVNEYSPNICETPRHTVDNILVEEFDGYVWRRVLGTGPMAGREANNVVVIDTLPAGMTFVSFQNKCPLQDYGASWDSYKIADGRWVVKWEIPVMQIEQKGSIVYTAEASFPSGKDCLTDDEKTENVAWILADKNSPVGDVAVVTVTCAKVPDPIIPTTLTKVADKDSYSVGDPITYTIGYKQTHGAIFNNAGASTQDWTLSGASLSNGTLSLPNGSTAKFNKSYSKNSYVEMNCAFTSYASTEVVLRDKIRLDIRLDWSTMKLTCYDGNQLKKEASIVFQGTEATLRIQLTDGIMRVWVDNDTTNSESFTVDNLTTTTAGCLGFNGIEAGDFKFSNIHVHTDYAYDLSIVDLVPAEVEVDESSFQSFHNGSAAGTGKLLKGADGDSIVWTGLANNPIAFGDTFTVTWKGTVKECSQKIINLAKAKLLGHAHNEIMAQAVSGCGEECPLTNTSLQISKDTVCAGESVKLVAGPVGNYKYIFFENGVDITGESTSNTLELTPISAGKYKYMVYVVSGTTRDPCHSPTDTLVLTVEKLPVGSNFMIDPFCKGNADVTAFENEVNNMLSNGVSYSWFDAQNQPTTQPDINGLTEAGDYKFSYTMTTQSGCESRQPSTLEFTLRAISGPTGTGMVSYILGDTAANGKFDKNLLQQDPSVVDVESGYTYNWYDENYQLLQGAPIPDVPAAGSTVTYHYYVNRTQPVGCVSDTLPVTVVVSGTTVPVPVNVSYCLNETAQPITATVSEVSDSNASWEVVYYDSDGNELTSEADRTPNTSVAGAITYYVSQREVGNPANESGKVPLVVTVVEVPLPDVSMNRTQYCKGEQYEPLQVKSNSPLYDANRSSFSWSVDGQSVTGVPLAQTQTEVVSYGVVESYEIESGHVCVSDTVKFAVKSTFVPVATGSLSVNYLKSEAAADGSFEPLLSKDPSAVTASDNSDYELVWFDDAMNELGTTDPSPKKDNSWSENEDVRLTYFVKQRHKESGCLSDTVRITVILSDALMPNTFPMNYCHHAKAFSLENNASINTNNGQVRDIDYELEWFSPEDNYASPLASAPVPSTETVGVTIYKVAQKHKNDGTVSTKAEVKVTVFPNPEIKVDALPQTCGEVIEISKYIHLANTVDTSLLNYYYFTDRNCVNPLSELMLTESTVFYANAYYTIFSEPNIIGYCASDTIEMNATIDDLTNLVVDAPSSVCPNGDIHLKASATSTTSSVSYEWSGAATGSADVLDTKDESGVFGEVHSYHLTASAGACHLDTTVSVTVGKGELTGDVLANNQATHNLKICEGEPVELSTTHDGQDFKWSDLSGGLVGSDKDVSVSPATTTTYVLSFMNKCETSDTVVVEVYPLSLTADFSLLDTSICEKSSASAVLTISGYDPSMSGSYIKWMKNGNELSEFAGQTTLRLDNVDKDDSGEYTYEVSNGICLAKTSDVKTTAQLEVKPYVLFAEPTTVLVPHGGSADLKILGLTPSDATVSWKGDLHDGASNPFTVTDMEKDELFAVTLSANGYCDSETEVQVLVDAKAVVSISVSADVVCVEDGVKVTADTTGTGHLLYPDQYHLAWYSLDGEANLSKLSGEGLSIHDYPQASASYFAVVTYGSQEAVSDTLAVEIVTPAVYTVTEDAVSCSGDEVTIEVSSEEEDVEVEWTEDGTKASSIVVAPTESRAYPFVITKKGLCPVSDQIPVSVKEKPTVTMDEEKTVCEGSDIMVSPTVTGKEYSSFAWTDPEGEIVSRELKLVMAPTLSGDYTLLVETSSCGDASASINVKVIPTPVLYIDSLGFTTRKIEVASGGSGTFEYKMDKQEWQSDNLYENLAYKVLHTAYARDEMGCVGVTVFNVSQPPVPIPEYFTPDGSGLNEVWDVAPILEAYPKSTVKIFDRTGKVIAELDSSMSDWDGTYNGNPLPSTDYWYIINVPEIRQQFTGHFTLIRGK